MPGQGPRSHILPQEFACCNWRFHRPQLRPMQPSRQAWILMLGEAQGIDRGQGTQTSFLQTLSELPCFPASFPPPLCSWQCQACPTPDSAFRLYKKYEKEAVMGDMLSYAPAQSYLTLYVPTDCSPPGSSVHEIIPAKILEWVAMPSSRGSSWPRDWTHVSCVSCIAGRFFTTEPLGNPGRSNTLKHLYNLQQMTGSWWENTSCSLPLSGKILGAYYPVSERLQQDGAPVFHPVTHFIITSFLAFLPPLCHFPATHLLLRSPPKSTTCNPRPGLKVVLQGTQLKTPSVCQGLCHQKGTQAMSNICFAALEARAGDPGLLTLNAVLFLTHHLCAF